MRKKISALLSLGLLIIATWIFFGTHAETEAPILRVGDQWTYQITSCAADEYVGGQVTEIVDRVEDFEGVRCYVCIQDYPWETRSVWMTSDWVVLKTDILSKQDGRRTIITVSPGMKLYDFPLSVGKEWSGESNITSSYVESDGEIIDDPWPFLLDWSRKVVSTDSIIVPAGTFDTYLVEDTGREYGDPRWWFSTDAKNHVRMERYGEEGQGDYQEVLTSYKLAPQGSGFSTLPLIIALAATIGVLGFTFFLYYRRHQGTLDM